jgi:hypothetical protein
VSFSPNFSKRTYAKKVRAFPRVGEPCSTHGSYEIHKNFLVGKPEKKIPRGIRSRKLEDNIKMNLSEIKWGGVVTIHLPYGKD